MSPRQQQMVKMTHLMERGQKRERRPDKRYTRRASFTCFGSPMTAIRANRRKWCVSFLGDNKTIQDIRSRSRLLCRMMFLEQCRERRFESETINFTIKLDLDTPIPFPTKAKVLLSGGFNAPVDDG